MPKKKKKIKTYKDLQKVLENLEIERPPFWSTMGVDVFGRFEIKEPNYLEPEEALRLGRFLVGFYAGADDGE